MGWNYDHRGPIAKRLGVGSLAEVPEYGIWIDIRRRCLNPERPNYKDYGGRGITVCDRWAESFEAFYADMGPRPSPKHSIDRIDVNGPYEPGNCRWATMRQQSNNKRVNRMVHYRGARVSLREALRLAGDVIEKSAARRRLELGWPVARAVETPPDPRFQKWTKERRRSA